MIVQKYIEYFVRVKKIYNVLDDEGNEWPIANGGAVFVTKRRNKGWDG